MTSAFPIGRDQHGKARGAIGRCRDCREPMLWATTNTGRRLPFELEQATPPYLGRAYVLLERGDWRLAVELRDDELRAEAPMVEGLDVRLCHFDACVERKRPQGQE